jgi:hypothetical protein
VRVQDAVTPAIEAVEPGDKMKVEVVPTRVTADELRRDGNDGGKKKNGWPDETTPALD